MQGAFFVAPLVPDEVLLNDAVEGGGPLASAFGQRLLSADFDLLTGRHLESLLCRGERQKVADRVIAFDT
ncbi:MAG: hypothetical protein HOP16_18980 [Acidobacteria bacterium]|nr:hypothetical protein [Acidobacteriota bacterium]